MVPDSDSEAATTIVTNSTVLMLLHKRSFITPSSLCPSFLEPHIQQCTYYLWMQIRRTEMHIRQTLYVSACVGASLGELLKKSFNFSGLQTTSFIRLKVNEEETQTEMQKKRNLTHGTCVHRNTSDWRAGWCTDWQSASSHVWLRMTLDGALDWMRLLQEIAGFIFPTNSRIHMDMFGINQLSPAHCISFLILTRLCVSLRFLIWCNSKCLNFLKIWIKGNV